MLLLNTCNWNNSSQWIHKAHTHESRVTHIQSFYWNRFDSDCKIAYIHVYIYIYIYIYRERERERKREQSETKNKSNLKIWGRSDGYVVDHPATVMGIGGLLPPIK